MFLILLLIITSPMKSKFNRANLSDFPSQASLTRNDFTQNRNFKQGVLLRSFFKSPQTSTSQESIYFSSFLLEISSYKRHTLYLICSPQCVSFTSCSTTPLGGLLQHFLRWFMCTDFPGLSPFPFKLEEHIIFKKQKQVHQIQNRHTLWPKHTV